MDFYNSKGERISCDYCDNLATDLREVNSENRKIYHCKNEKCKGHANRDLLPF